MTRPIQRISLIEKSYHVNGGIDISDWSVLLTVRNRCRIEDGATDSVALKLAKYRGSIDLVETQPLTEEHSI